MVKTGSGVISSAIVWEARTSPSPRCLHFNGERGCGRARTTGGGLFALVFLLFAVALVSATLCLAAGPATKPPVPTGVDPGGVLVALIGDGVDYTQPELAARLARDGEGEIIGWDVHDKDRRPYGIDFLKGFTTRQSAAAMAIVGQPGMTRLAVFRVASHDRDQWIAETAAAIGMAASTHARLIILPAHAPDDLLSAATKQFPTLLFLVPTFRGEDVNYDTVIKVTNVAVCKEPYSAVDGDGLTYAADIATDSACSVMPMLGSTYPLAETAAGRIAALAARLLRAEPKLTAAELRARIVALAKPFPEGRAKTARHGWIEDPSAHFAGK
jgi:hypothetical protein